MYAHIFRKDHIIINLVQAFLEYKIIKQKFKIINFMKLSDLFIYSYFNELISKLVS